MASQAPDVKSTCLVCFNTRALKIVGNCKHSFCTKCLSIVLDSLESESKTFACPSCKVDCPRPLDGVDGLVDFKGNVVDTNTEHKDAPTEKETESQKRQTGNASCDLCTHRQATVPAANICSECYNLHICQDCTKKHRRNKATKDHLLTPVLTKRKKDPTCEVHYKELLSFCITCAKPVCVVCVSLDHGDHDVEKLADTIRSKVEEVKVALRMQEEKLKDVQFWKRELTSLKEMAPTVDKQDILIKEIEDEAQKRIDEIVKQKEALKRQVKQKYKVVRDIPVALDKTSETVVKMQEPINRANQVLSEQQPHLDYLDKLTSLQLHLEVSAKQWEDVEMTDYRTDLNELHRNDRRFISDPETGGLGTLSKNPREHLSDLQEIFQHKMNVDSQDMYIPSIACLSSKYFAVAHPVKPGGLSDAVDIYEFPGTLKRTFRDHVFPIYDMSATPDSKFAILSDGTDGTSCSVKLFDAESGYVSSTCNISITKPLSFGVTENYQYVLLGNNQEGQMQITVTDTEGKQEYAVTLAEDKVRNPNMIACGGRLIFVEGDERVSVYKIRATGLQFISVCSLINVDFLVSMSATLWEDFFIVSNCFGDYFIDEYQDKENQSNWVRKECIKITKIMENADIKKPRLSMKDGDTFVMATGQTIRVYKWNWRSP